MPRRVSLPTADDLFRPTADEGLNDPTGQVRTSRARSAARVPTTTPDPTAPAKPARAAARKPVAKKSSGRVKHDEKMTVYLTSDELLAIEKARLELRALLGRKVDRGRLVRAAIAGALTDLETRGAESDIARRLAED